MTKQVHLAAHFPGVNNTTVWSDPAAGSHIEFSSFVRFAQAAERGKFDFLFLAEGLRLREQNGAIYDLDVVGRPDTFTVLAALAAVTEHLGLAGTINSTFNEPYEVARQFASLVVADKESGTFLRDASAGTFAHSDAHFDIAGRFDVPRSPQGRPVVFQAGDSEEGREFAASAADAIFSRHATLEAGQAFYADVKGRLAKYGRTPADLLILPAATFVVGETDAEAAELAAEVRRQQVSGQTALRKLEEVWNRDLSGYDPDGPLPEVDPLVGEHTVAQGRASVRMNRDPLAVARDWRERAEAKGLSIRELMIEISSRQNFIGSPTTIAEQMIDLVQADASDGFILVPHITPGGLDPLVDSVVPVLQERGAYRTEYPGTTLRDNLGLPPLAGAR
jgi:alkanesulfonate monooxygenase SsuD/methylene tetrahydromethanopterin reductase-like flavin-dependent oxidoreductase (luciferase family)